MAKKMLKRSKLSGASNRTEDATRYFQITTIVAGYVLFLLLVVGVMSTTVIPWLTVINNHPQSSYESSMAFLLAMVAGVLLPVFI